MARKQNPIGFDKPTKPVKSPKPRRARKKKVSADGKTQAQREKEIKTHNYKDRAKRMRGFFGDGFKAKDGYDLRKINSWTPAQKAKVTRYFRVIAPRITGEFIVKRYRIPENREAAIVASLQEELLPGQTAAAFSVDPGEKINIKIKRGKATVKRGGIEQIKMTFDKQAFLEDPDAEIDRLLAETDANVFRILVGGQQQNKTLTRADVKDEIVRLVRKYAPENIQRDHRQRPFDEWLNGLVAYPGTQKKTYTQVEGFVRRHVSFMEKKESERLDNLGAERMNVSVKEFRRRRTVRTAQKKRGKRGPGKRVR